MEAFAFWFLMILFVLGLTATVAQIGKPRQPLTSGVAAATFVIVALQSVAVWYLYTH